DAVLGAAVQLGVAALPAEALRLGHRDALHADVRDGLADVIELERLDDRGDQLHRGFRNASSMPRSCAIKTVPGSGVATAGRTAMVRGFGALASTRGSCLHSPSMDARFIDDLARRLAAAVPPGISSLRRDLEDYFKAVLQAGLTRLDLVWRQEFDVQAGVLRRTREKLEALEARLATLENGQKSPTAKPQ